MANVCNSIEDDANDVNGVDECVPYDSMMVVVLPSSIDLLDEHCRYHRRVDLTLTAAIPVMALVVSTMEPFEMIAHMNRHPTIDWKDQFVDISLNK